MELQDVSVIEFINSKEETLSLEQILSQKIEVKKVVLDYLDKAGKEKELVIEDDCGIMMYKNHENNIVIKFKNRKFFEDILDYDETTLSKDFEISTRPHTITIHGSNITALEW